MMRRCAPVVVLACLAGAPVWAAEPAPLARARALYNAGDFDAAIAAATEARKIAAAAEPALLVLARSHLERYRQRADPADLTTARESLQGVRLQALAPRDRVDLIVGYGQSLFLSEAFGAAAELFDTALMQSTPLPPRSSALLLDWWASALDREAQSRPVDRRAPIFQKIEDRMVEELHRDPGSATATYWLVVATRGTGDFERSWDVAIAGWVRAALNPDTATTLRADIDRFVTQALVADRARQRQPQGGGDAVAALRNEWELIKSQWK
jgi:hypothetical protein